MPIRPVLPLHQRRVDRPARLRHAQGRDHRRHRAEDHSRGNRNHAALLSRLLHHGIGQALPRDLVRSLGTTSFTGPGRRDRLPVGIKDRVFVDQIAVRGDEVHQPTPGASLEVVDHRNNVLGRPFASHDADHQPTLDINRDMVPGVPLTVVGRVGLIAILLLLGDERPLLIKLRLASEGGKSRPTRRGGRGSDHQRSGSGGRRRRDRPCSGHREFRRQKRERSSMERLRR